MQTLHNFQWGFLCGTDGLILPSAISLSERMNDSTHNLPVREVLGTFYMVCALTKGKHFRSKPANPKVCVRLFCVVGI